MGGQVLELYSEKIRKEARKEGRREGQKDVYYAVLDIRNGVGQIELKKKYDAGTIKIAMKIG